MSNIVDLDSRRPPEKYWVVIAMCMPCGARWVGTVPILQSLFTLECPSCGAKDSFASFIPKDYSEAMP